MKLAAFEKRWFDTVARVLIPPGALGGIVDDVDAGGRFDDDVDAGPFTGAMLLRAVLWVVWLLPIVVGPRRRFFGGLDGAERIVALERMLSSPVYLVRSAASFVKLTVCMAVLGDARVNARLGAYESVPEDKIVRVRRGPQGEVRP